MDRKLLDILCCPLTKQPLALLDTAELEALNAAIAAGGVQRQDGSAQVEPIREGLVTRDHQTLYRIDDGIPVLLADEAIATATRTADFVAATVGTRARILDTRKTLPGLRQAQKYAVRAGGGDNHRMGLYDTVMLKENHILAAGSIAAAAARARQLHPGVPLVIEVESLDELRQALDTDCDRILVDDFSEQDLRQAVAIASGRTALEVSGGVGLERVAAIAATGVDCISVGALTKHVRAVDFSMRLGEPPAAGAAG